MPPQVKQRSTAWDDASPGLVRLWHCCPNFARLMIPARATLRFIPHAAAAGGGLILRIPHHRGKDSMSHKVTLIPVWPAVEIPSVWTAAPLLTVLLTDEWPIRGDKDADTGGFFSISSLVKWRWFFYLDLFKPRAGQALQLAAEGEGYAECKFMRISMF